MTSTPAPPPGTMGVIHIVRQARSGDQERPFNFLISFGGEESGALYIGEASGVEDLRHLLKKLGISSEAIDAACRRLAVERRHLIPDVSLSRNRLGQLGLL